MHVFSIASSETNLSVDSASSCTGTHQRTQHARYHGGLAEIRTRRTQTSLIIVVVDFDHAKLLLG